MKRHPKHRTQRLVPLSTMVGEKQKSAIENIAAERGLSTGWIVREAIGIWIKQQTPKKGDQK